MDAETLEGVYLAIGTGNRAREREPQEAEEAEDDDEQDDAAEEDDEDSEPVHVILGEKGLGRLLAMRLGEA